MQDPADTSCHSPFPGHPQAGARSPSLKASQNPRSTCDLTCDLTGVGVTGTVPILASHCALGPCLRAQGSVLKTQLVGHRQMLRATVSSRSGHGNIPRCQLQTVFSQTSFSTQRTLLPSKLQASKHRAGEGYLGLQA